MTDQRVGRHVRIYEWDEVDIEENNEEVHDIKVQATPEAARKPAPQEQPRGLSGLLKRKIF